MNLTDIIILLIILLGGVVGFKEGGIKKATSIIGLVLVVVLSFILKNKLSVLFYENLPFINLWGAFKGIQILNVIFYELLAFVIIASVLFLIYNLILRLSGLLEKLLKATIILSIPSKIIGFVIGLLESYVWMYVFLIVLTIPFINLKLGIYGEYIYDGKVSTFIVNNTPVLSKYTKGPVKVYKEIYEIIDNKDNLTDEEVNIKSMEIFLKYNIITVESAEKLINKNKVVIEDDSFIDKYK